MNRLKKSALLVPTGSPPILPIYAAMALGPSLAQTPTPAPAPGPNEPHHHFDGESQVKDFIQTLLHYSGYNEMADILLNLTNLATEMGDLVSEGYAITILAPNDEAMAKLTTDQLSEPRAPEQIMYYHIIPEYQDGGKHVQYREEVRESPIHNISLGFSKSKATHIVKKKADHTYYISPCSGRVLIESLPQNDKGDRSNKNLCKREYSKAEVQKDFKVNEQSLDKIFDPLRDLALTKPIVEVATLGVSTIPSHIPIT
ncbi:hypothetical protein F0562_032133 [Nyssa sinensis]|uniref:FAS1 domain-containing protein n=1 Tax=Nyssa sinensis TaxID=561372 RepID=A0A5J5AWB3_9ASTE|nr:hypothetical protein F0562_032133 [Nyssa sinensis]